MSKLEELIQKLCPDGVEYYELGNIGKISMCKRILKAQTNTKEGVPFYKIGTFGGVANAYISNDLFQEYKEKYSYPKKGDILLSAAGTIGRTVVFDGKPSYFQDSNIVWLANDESKVCNQFLCYFYETKPWKVSDGSTIKRLYNDNIAKTKIPVPPMEVQQEIVRLLDDFTAKTAELQAELNKEYEARKKQYEYLKNEMFSFDKSSAEISKLETYFPDIRNGFVGTATPYFTTEKEGVRYLKGTNIHNGVISDNDYCYITREFHEKHIKSELKNNDILMVQSGHVGECAVVDKQYIGSNCHALIIMSNNGKCSSKYVVHYFHTIKGKRQLSKITTGGTIKHILASDIKKVKIPFPTVEKQKAIVETLDKLEIYYNSIQLCLLDELESRQKQYEFYRDKLLTFKELK